MEQQQCSSCASIWSHMAGTLQNAVDRGAPQLVCVLRQDFMAGMKLRTQLHHAFCGCSQYQDRLPCDMGRVAALRSSHNRAETGCWEPRI